MKWVQKKWISVDSLKIVFLSWKNIIEAYNSLNNVYEENKENQHIDSETSRQLNHALEIIDKALDNKITEENKTAIEGIKTDIVTLRKNLSTENKKAVTKKLETILHKIKKTGIKFSKEILSEAQKEIIKRIIKNGIELGKDYISDIIH